MPGKGFDDLRVLSFESRRAREMAQLISNNGGRATVVPCTREIPTGPNDEEAAFARGLKSGQFEIVIFTTGVGARALAQAIEPLCSRADFAASLGRTVVVARGPKPVAALRELGVSATLTVPEPNTWREILRALEENADKVRLQGARVAVQEHGEPSRELYAALARRGALVFAVPVYKWALPEDVAPLRNTITQLAHGDFDVLLFTASVQAHQLFRLAEESGQGLDLRRALGRAVIASIGPVTSETLHEYGVAVDFEPSHPKMGILVSEVAQRSRDLLQRKKP